MQRLFLTSSIAIPGVGASIRARLRPNFPETSTKLTTVFINTPVEGDADQSDLTWVEEERIGLRNSNFDIFDYTITGKPLAQIRQDLEDIQVLYVSGGNEFYFREKCRDSHFDDFVHDFVQAGGIYIGTSAGSIIAGKDMTALKQLSDLNVLQREVETAGFGLVNFTILPHWGSEEFKTRWLSPESFEFMYKEDTPLIALNNYQYIEVHADQWQIVDVRHEP